MNKKAIMKKLNKNPDGPIFFNGFEYGLKAEKILTMNKIKRSLYFLIKWEDINKPTLVKTIYANNNCHSLVLQFYEGIIEWIK